MSSPIFYGRAAVPFDGYGRGYGRYGDGDATDPDALQSGDLDSCQEALDRFQQAVLQAQAATTTNSGSSILTSWLLGADSTLSATQSNVQSLTNLYQVMATKLQGWQNDPSTTSHSKCVQFVTDVASYADVNDILQTMHMLQASTLVSTVASQTASQVAAGVKKATSLVPWWVWLAGGAAVLLALGWKPFSPSRSP